MFYAYYAKFHNWMDKKLFNTKKNYYTIIPHLIQKSRNKDIKNEHI